MPVETEIERHPDGSVTVWCSDHDPMQRMKGMHGVCLHPERAVVELKVRLYNRTPYQQTFLWWANVATRVHEKYQSFFPPDVSYVADHAKRAMTPSRFVRPLLRRGCTEAVGYAADDLSRYANIPVPTSYMDRPAEDFLGGYDHRRGGRLHVADHHILQARNNGHGEIRVRICVGTQSDRPMGRISN